MTTNEEEIEKKLSRVEGIRRLHEGAACLEQLTEIDREWVNSFLAFIDSLPPVNISARLARRVFAFQSWAGDLGLMEEFD